jgi:RNA polymerase sigma-70 factor (ECF subfamily)
VETAHARSSAPDEGAEPIRRAEDPLPSFDEIHASYFDFVWASLRGLGVALSGLDDAVQDVFIVLHRRLPDFEGRSSLKTFLFGIVVGVARNHRRSARRADRLDPLDAAPEVPDEAASPLDRAVATQALETLGRILDQMDDAKREVLVLAEWEQMSAPEIAEALGVGVNTVYSRLRLARAEFDRLLSRDRGRGR